MLKPVLGSQIQLGHPLAKGLVGYWPMNEGTGNVVSDLSGNGRTLTLTGDVSWWACKFGSAIDFVGDADYLIDDGSGPPNLVDQGDITISLWFSQDVVRTEIQALIRVRDAAIVVTTSGFRWFPDIDGGSPVEFAYTLNAAQWYHLAVTQNSAKAYVVYIDGKAISSGTSGVGIDMNAAGRGTLVGALSTTGTWDFNGKLDNISVYNRALSPGEIQDLYSNPFGMFQPTFSVWWYSGIGGEPPATFGQVIMISN